MLARAGGQWHYRLRECAPCGVTCRPHALLAERLVTVHASVSCLADSDADESAGVYCDDADGVEAAGGGAPSVVRACRSLLDHAVAGGDLDADGKPLVVLKLLVGHGVAGTLIGAGGATRKALGRRSGALVRVGTKKYLMAPMGI